MTKRMINTDIEKLIGNRLRIIRKLRGYSQLELGILTGITY